VLVWMIRDDEDRVIGVFNSQGQLEEYGNRISWSTHGYSWELWDTDKENHAPMRTGAIKTKVVLDKLEGI